MEGCCLWRLQESKTGLLEFFPIKYPFLMFYSVKHFLVNYCAKWIGRPFSLGTSQTDELLCPNMVCIQVGHSVLGSVSVRFLRLSMKFGS